MAACKCNQSETSRFSETVSKKIGVSLVGNEKNEVINALYLFYIKIKNGIG